MIGYTCRYCGSTNLRKNGRTANGQQKFHCKDCNAYGTLDTKTDEREQRRQVAAQLAAEGLSQRTIARTLKMGRRTVRNSSSKKA